jgi:hypothetical protein
VFVSQHAAIEGNLPPQSGEAVDRFAGKVLFGSLPAMQGTLALIAYINVAGELPGMEGVIVFRTRTGLLVPLSGRFVLPPGALSGRDTGATPDLGGRNTGGTPQLSGRVEG